MANNTKVLAIQVSEEFHAAIKCHLKKNKISLKDFLTGLITPALDDTAPEPALPADAVTEDIAAPTEEPAITVPDPAPAEDATADAESAEVATTEDTPAKKKPAKKSTAGRKKK